MLTNNFLYKQFTVDITNLN